MLTTILAVVVCVIVLLAVIIKVFFSIEGDPEVVVDTKNRTKFTVTKRDDKSVTLTSKVEFKNIGKQRQQPNIRTALRRLPFGYRLIGYA